MSWSYPVTIIYTSNLILFSIMCRYRVSVLCCCVVLCNVIIRGSLLFSRCKRKLKKLYEKWYAHFKIQKCLSIQKIFCFVEFASIIYYILYRSGILTFYGVGPRYSQKIHSAANHPSSPILIHTVLYKHCS